MFNVEMVLIDGTEELTSMTTQLKELPIAGEEIVDKVGLRVRVIRRVFYTPGASEHDVSLYVRMTVPE